MRQIFLRNEKYIFLILTKNVFFLRYSIYHARESINYYVQFGQPRKESAIIRLIYMLSTRICYFVLFFSNIVSNSHMKHCHYF